MQITHTAMKNFPTEMLFQRVRIRLRRNLKIRRLMKLHARSRVRPIEEMIILRSLHTSMQNILSIW